MPVMTQNRNTSPDGKAMLEHVVIIVLKQAKDGLLAKALDQGGIHEIMHVLTLSQQTLAPSPARKTTALWCGMCRTETLQPTIRKARVVPVQQVHQVQWMVPIDDGGMVRESIQNGKRLHAGLWQQQQVCRQGTWHRSGTRGTHNGPNTQNSWLTYIEYAYCAKTVLLKTGKTVKTYLVSTPEWSLLLLVQIRRS